MFHNFAFIEQTAARSIALRALHHLATSQIRVWITVIYKKVNPVSDRLSV